MQCPNCLTDVDDETTECPTCGARRAYGLDVVESMLGKAALRRQVAGFLLGVASLTLAQIHVLVTGSHASWSTPGPTLGPLWIEGFLLVAGPGILVVLWADLAGLIMRLRTGPRWFGPRGHRGHVPALARRQWTDTVATPCPACGTPVHATAVSCRACRARRGYRLDARLDGGAIVTDRTQARLALTTWIGGMGLSVAALVALVSPILAAGAVPQRMLPLMICLTAWIGLAIAITVRRINRYRGGPRWFPPYGQDPLPEPVGTGAPRAPRPD